MKNLLSVQQEIKNNLAEYQNRVALSEVKAPVFVPVEVATQQTTTTTTKKTMNEPEIKTVVVPVGYTAPSKRVVAVPTDYVAPKQLDAEWTAMALLANSLSGLDLDYPNFPEEGQKAQLKADLKAALAAGRKAIRTMVKEYKAVESVMSEMEIAVAVAQIKNLEVATVEASLRASQSDFEYVCEEVTAAPAVVSVGSIHTSIEATACIEDIKIKEKEMAAIIKEIKFEIEESDPSEHARLEAEIEAVQVEAQGIINNVKATLAGRIRIRRTTMSNAITINETSAQFRARALEELLNSMTKRPSKHSAPWSKATRAANAKTRNDKKAGKTNGKKVSK